MADTAEKVLVATLQHQIEEKKEEYHALLIKYNAKLAYEKDISVQMDELQNKLESEKKANVNNQLRYNEETRKNDLLWKEKIEQIKFESETKIKDLESRISEMEKEISSSAAMLQKKGNKLKELEESMNCVSELLNAEMRKKEIAEEQLKSLKEQLEERLAYTEEKLQIKEEEVENLKEKLLTATDDAALYYSQLQEMKVPQQEVKDSNAMDPLTKGNSLFAEVDDRRQIMKQQLLKEKNKYAKIHVAYKAKCSQVHHLQSQLLDMSRKWKDDAQHNSSTKDDLIKSLNSHIKVLEENLKAQEIKLEKFGFDGEFTRRMNLEPLAEFRLLQNDLDDERNEVKRLREKLQRISMEKILQSEEINDLSVQLKKVRAENAYLLRSEESKKLAAELSGTDVKDSFAHQNQ